MELILVAVLLQGTRRSSRPCGASSRPWTSSRAAEEALGPPFEGVLTAMSSEIKNKKKNKKNHREGRGRKQGQRRRRRKFEEVEEDVD